ncbi:MAG: hypothetical protein HC899_16560 [Leptolyngbyaceae cyanobacterium SM1_4_3]|nr:hypothetical protein [Leptolyngbyaceae cyanobacterium SM1_4_3]
MPTPPHSTQQAVVVAVIRSCANPITLNTRLTVHLPRYSSAPPITFAPSANCVAA